MILCYHKVDLIAKTHFWVSVDEFYKQMHALQGKVVSLEKYNPHNKSNVCIIFDGVYENVYKYAFPILKHFNYPFELFIIGNHIGKDNSFDTPEPPANFCNLTQLIEMSQAGGRIQWHTKSHSNLNNLSNLKQIDELIPDEYLQEAFPKSKGHFKYFAYPHGHVDAITKNLVKENFDGALAVTNHSNIDDIYALPRHEIHEKVRIKTIGVSLIIANYNYGRFISDCLESVLSQTIIPDEILISDDASTDDSHEKINVLAKKFGNFNMKININAENMGIINHFNKAVRLTNEKLVIILGADNRIRPDFIDECKSRFLINPHLGVCSSDMMIFGPSAYLLAKKVGAHIFAESKVEGYDFYNWKFPTSPINLEELSRKNRIHGSAMFSRKAFEDVGGYKKSTLPEDHNFFLRVLQNGYSHSHVSKPILDYRQHSPSQANTVLNLQRENQILRNQLNKSTQ